MNLRAIANAHIQAVNPDILVPIQQSNGSITSASGKQVPQYLAPKTVPCNIQALQYNDIAQIDGLSIEGIRRKVYVNGAWNGISRSDQEGGDLLQFPEHTGGPLRNWLVVFVFEQWPDWCSLCVTQQ